ncbi:aminotransferase class IV [Candidatus Deianiraea vastatrix]|uniref:Probable branched-chain-amino-acid aminotransferase n=1 Tax=Candidatus Deianiraea vastatrix TaxID=2163644 RepID=A0A5B8XCW7_9RICK|nr:aminotransferase class IV [Candidatus Deianiraea vastatrix]QED23153.1 D-alanine aminotransferase [Candidatus Deianiraea vastatrix]
MSTIFLNGSYITRENAKISVDDRGFHFGDGMYDIMLIHNGKIIDFDKHYERISNTASRIFMNLDLQKDEIFAIAHKLMADNKVEKGRLIIVISRGEGDRWVSDFSKMPQNFMIEVQDADCGVGTENLKLISAKLHEDIRWKYRDIKITSLLPSVILRAKFEKDGYGEVLYHEDGKICETSRGNIFIIKNNVIKTPPLSHKLLPGITRFRILQLLNCGEYVKFLNSEDAKIISGFKALETDFSIDEILDADEVFSSSSTIRIAGISKIDDKEFARHDITKVLLRMYDNFIS